MIDETIIGNPLFQLNLILFLTWPSPPLDQINPIFYQAGYQFSYIERELFVPESANQRMQSADLLANRSIHPETLLEHPEKRFLLPIECKKSSFGPDSSTCRQARALLTLTGPEISQQLGIGSAEDWQAVLTYVSRSQHGERILSTLQELAAQLSGVGVQVAPFASLELIYSDRGIDLWLVPQSAALPNLDFAEPVRVLELYNDLDPRPLYLLPYMPSGDDKPDPISEQVFHERIRLAAALLFRYLDDSQHEYELDDIIAETIQLWHQWAYPKEKKHVRDHARQWLRGLFAEIEQETEVHCDFKPKSNTIIIPPVPAIQKRKLRRFVEKALRRKPIDFTRPVQRTIYDALDES